MMIQKILILSIFSAFLALFPMNTGVLAQENPVSGAFRSTNYPLPRFVSLRSDEVYVRSGPGQKYPVQWVFKKAGLPVEIVLEYDIWRKIKDFEGQTGWVHKSLLSGNRSGIIAKEEMVSLHRKSNKDSRIHAYLQPKVLVRIDECTESWCLVKASGYKGWLEKSALWGVYENEIFD